MAMYKVRLISIAATLLPGNFTLAGQIVGRGAAK